MDETCADYIYDEEYEDFLVKYDRDLDSIYQFLNPACVQVVNNQFLVAYKREDPLLDPLLSFGYSVIPRCYGLMDTGAYDATGASRIKKLPGLALSGEDVLVGFVDTGIDYQNPLFLDENGRTRIAAIWDQNEVVLGSGASVYGYGALYERTILNQALSEENPFSIVPSRDTNGHGTFLASVACGSDFVENPDQAGESFSGIAPKSDILVVKLKEAKRNLRQFFAIREDVPCYSEIDIILGIKFLLEQAVKLAKPLVICLGIGTNLSGHDGMTNLEIYLNSLTGLRGVCVVSCTGNELGFANHTSVYAQKMSNYMVKEPLELVVASPSRGFSMELWGNAPASFQCTVVSPTGERFMGPAANQRGAVQKQFVFEGTKVFLYQNPVEKNAGDPFLFLRFNNPSEGIWRLFVEEASGRFSGDFEAWLLGHTFLDGDITFAKQNPSMTIVAPGNGQGSITAGGYNYENGAIYLNSGRGFTRKGIIKPDLVAPAQNVQGAYFGNRFIRRSGSSIAAAFLAGAVALLLEWGLVRGNYPAINLEIIRQLFIRGARREEDFIYPDTLFGWGILDLVGVFEDLR